MIEEHRPDLVVFEIAERYLTLPLAQPMGLEENFGASSAVCDPEPVRANAQPTNIEE